MYESYGQAPPTMRSAPSSREPGIQGFAWSVWAWMNWSLPLFICFHGWLGGGGWETLALTLFSPVIVPMAGLLGALPRFILRRRGHSRAPAPIVWLLFLNWWSWFVFAASMSGATDGAPLDSMLRSLVPGPLSTSFEAGILIGGMLLGVVSWIAIVVLACLAGVDSARGRGWVVVDWIAAFAVPALIVLTVSSGVAVTLQQTDASGRTMLEVQNTPIADQAATAAARYEQVQSSLSEVRALLAADGWRLDVFGLISGPTACANRGADCYHVQAGFTHPTAGSSVDLSAILDALEEKGWEIDRAGPNGATLTDVDGAEVEFSVRADGETRISIRSPSWWGDDFDIHEELGRGLDDDDVRARTYRAEEWPPL